jgi:hypothetical protein
VRAHFGLGADTEAATVEIRWPSGIEQRLEHVHGDQYVRVEEPASTPTAVSHAAASGKP